MPDNRLTSKAATDILTSRTKYHMSPRWTGTFKTSQLVPIYADSTIRPGDTIKLNISQVIRGTTPVFPVMDDAYLSVECFFVKHKHLLSRQMMSPSTNDSNRSFKAWIGAQDSLLNMPLPDNDIRLPELYVSSDEPYKVGGLGDCLGFAKPNIADSYYYVNALKPLAYYSVWNSFFREPNLQSPVTFTIGNTNLLVFTGSDAGIVGNASNVGNFSLAGVCRDHGYFGSALPWPQRNTDAINVPLGDRAPVYSMEDAHADGDSIYPHFDDGALPLHVGYLNSEGKVVTNVSPLTVGIDGDSNMLSFTANGAQQSYSEDGLYPLNLWTDLSQATAATVNQVRYAFATQRWFEQLARSGNRYDELVYGMTGVRQSDAYDDRPEYLGGKKIPLTASQVNSTNGASGGALGNVGAFTHASDSDYYFTKSFDDFGTLIILAFVRVKDTFAQGVAREDTVFDKFDMYWSQFANIGEVPILNKEIFVQGLDASGNPDDKVFGYQEAWANYRLKLDQVTGLARPGQAYQYLTYVNNFSSLPTLKSFLTGSQVANVDQTLAVASISSGLQWIAQFQFDMQFIRQIPMYSIPGYLDHH